MQVRFGLHLDGLQPQPPATASGVVTVGPAGLLSVLETQLGLPPQASHPSEAAFSYLQCLREVASPQHFFTRSLQVDPVNVARKLLDWREQWYAAGWDGSFPADASGRLADMAAVEARARGRVPPSRGERLQRVAAALSERTTQIEQVVLHTPMAHFPSAWQRVLAALPCALAAGLDPAPGGPAGSDLERVQARLLDVAGGGEDRPGEREQLRGDGSLIVVRAGSRDLSADAVAEFLLAAGTGEEALLVAEQDGIILDNALERAGLARCGFRYHTRFRAATQVLKLSLALLWAPVDAHRTLQFLLHPTGPLPRWVRSRLADAVASSPGIGGPVWAESLEGIEKTHAERAGAVATEPEQLRADIAYWLENERFDAKSGVPLPLLIGRVQRVSNWASARAGTADSAADAALFGAAQAQAEALIEGLAGLRGTGVEHIARLELERVIDEVSTDAADPALFAEAGHVRATLAPAAVTSPWHTVIWWNLAPPAAAVSYPWSRHELAALRAAGVQLPEVDELLRQRSGEWIRPVLHATRRLVLVVHEEERGSHPIWTQIEHLFQGFASVEVEQALLAGEAALAPLEVPLRSLPLQPLPAPRRWWVLPPACPVPRRDIESYSSLSRLCDFPHTWVLHYAARLRTGRATDVADGPLLYGTLGHRLIETFFQTHTDWRAMPEQAVLLWVRSTFPGLVEREGAVLLAPGRGVDRQRVGVTLERALVRLLWHLRSAGIEHVAPEASGVVSFTGRQLTGSIDLLLTDATGNRAVVDVKYSGQGYRRGLLADNRALQLATYAYLQKRLDGTEAWPSGAFFILATGNLLANERGRFPDALVSPSSTGEGVEALWHRLSRTYHWRWGQLERGCIEVSTSHTAPDDDSAPPDDALAPVTGGAPFDDFVHLTGWEAN